MRRVSRIFFASALFLVACGVETAPIDPASDTDPTGTGEGSSGDPTSKNKDPSSNDPQEEEEEPGGIVADLRADTNRDGVVSFESKVDDDGEDVWDAQHGAVFLANIDDDESACNPNLDDTQVAKCNDAADDEVNGADDALDLARLKTKPWAAAPGGAKGSLTWTGGEHVRLFAVKGSAFSVVESGLKLTEADLKGGIELAIEGKDVVRDAEWDGYVDFTFTVDAEGKSKTDKVRMRIAPLLTYHHLSPTEQTWVSASNNQGNADMRADLAEALAAAGLPPVKGVNTSDTWNQDYFETGFMSMPAVGGKQHAIRVNIRSANIESNSATNPLRTAGRVVWQLRGKDTAGIQQFKASRTRQESNNDSLNSFGNLETVPPYSANGQSYPLGRVIRGSTASVYPDKIFTAMMEAQKVQPPIYVDTSWLVVGHIDETISFVKANNARGWVMLANDAPLAKSMFEARSNAGQGSTPLHVGKFWSGSSGNGSAQVTINQLLADTDVMSASAEAAVEVAAQVAKIKQETGLTDAEIVKVPFLHQDLNGASVAYQPGMVNGIYISDTRFVSPDPHGPVIGGQDIFKQAMSAALAPFNITVHFAEDWDTYHRQLGEVHCGTNATRQIPQAKWWESGR
ncbi:MAG: Protein-arginine deiminase type [Labilithrix sp.]|nr:Protein-arginine deiminase type [Labilithrix sp.]